MIIKHIPLFSIISMIELKPFRGSTICRAAGTKCLLIGRKQNLATLKLTSKWQIQIPSDTIAMLGQVSNITHKFQILGKAGKQRALGFRPSVRGVAKNPCDHPHGGGNGKKSHPPIPVTA
jgi:large subunit ribosomal protein L2